ncbi:MAG: gliding motility-associated C-terminal domain-containing protein, partial [Marinoscillum sp.]|uniref:T9SS type B sorting domain-containing protein n=1 Tax=Marinoscillum sp. TaxID=2024838 RepID=UPI0032FF8FA2
GNDESLFDIVGSSGVVTFKSAPDFENPTDADANNTYVINVEASDGTNASNQDVTITVTDVDDTAPVFTSALTTSFAENGTGTAYTALATDASALTYSLGTGNDESLFDIVGSSGVVTFKSAPDFENPADADANNTYVINVLASDGINTANQDVTITVTDVDDTAPVFTSALTASFAENGTGTAYTATATDSQTITYSLGTGNDESLFDIVGSTGVVTFKTAPDFENPADADANNTYLINVVASDGTNASNQDVTITVTDVDDTAPVFTSALTASFAENGTGTAYTALATDANSLIYSLGTGNDESLFDIVGSTGVVTFKTAPDFENPADADANNTYVINVVASDGTNASNQDVTITVTDVDDTAPVFTSALTASFAENGTGTAYTALATDANSLTYSLGSGNDESLFDIVGSTGVVTFKSAPDFENPTDADANNTYVINVVASDGSNASNQDVTITVTDVDDTAPVFTSALTASFAENGTGTAYTATATGSETITYSLGTGNDESLFDIVGSTGVVTFKSAPDFENPTDADANNTYVINVVASDGVNASNQDVTITVTDVEENTPVADIMIPTAITPNGDGANDQWQLPGIEFFPNSRVAVLDRNGHVVFESKGYTTPWDGTDNGRELAADTYYYSVDLTRDGGKTHKGFVLILK